MSFIDGIIKEVVAKAFPLLIQMAKDHRHHFTNWLRDQAKLTDNTLDDVVIEGICKWIESL